MDDLKREQDFYRQQCNEMGSRLLRLQEEGLARDLDATAATYFLLGAMNWIYQWYKVDGRLTEEQLVRELTFIYGFLGAAPKLDFENIAVVLHEETAQWFTQSQKFSKLFREHVIVIHIKPGL